jgi:hypothetical protein
VGGGFISLFARTFLDSSLSRFSVLFSVLRLSYDSQLGEWQGAGADSVGGNSKATTLCCLSPGEAMGVEAFFMGE